MTAVTVYQGNALVTRLVDVPTARGWSKSSSRRCRLRPSTARFTPRALTEFAFSAADTGRGQSKKIRERVRAKEMQIRTLKLEAERLKNETQVAEQNLQLLTKLENFTSVTMQHLAEKGLLNSEATLTLAKYVMTTRGRESGRPGRRCSRSSRPTPRPPNLPRAS